MDEFIWYEKDLHNCLTNIWKDLGKKILFQKSMENVISSTVSMVYCLKSFPDSFTHTIDLQNDAWKET